MSRNIRLIIGLLSLSCLMFISCGDEDTYDFQGDTENKVYIKPIENTVNGSDRALLAINKTPSLTIKGTLKLPVSSTLPVKGDVSITFSVDNSLVEDYNAKNSTSYKAIPTGAVELINNGLKIPSNATTSEGVVEITIHNDKIADLTEEEYLVAIKINEITGNAVISSNRSIFYVLVRIYVDTDNIWDTTPDEAFKGSLLTIDRTGWTVTTVNSSFSGSTNGIFDNSTSTYVGYVVSSYDDNTGFTVDMKQEYSNISGIQKNFRSASYRIISSDIYTSTDNTTWTYQGHFDNTANIANIYFYKPVKARYIKTIVRSNSRNVSIRDFNIYVKD